MKGSFKLRCEDTNAQHTTFNLFDGHGANCGRVTVLTSELPVFLENWSGLVEWQGRIPDEVLKELEF